MAAQEKAKKPAKAPVTKMPKAEKVEKNDQATASGSKHPQYDVVEVECSCGNKFKTRSALGRKDLHLEICSACHPFYTGQQKLIDTTGRVEKFKQKYAKKSAA
jgi:large subunit ribosomal protein L31